MDTEKRIHPYKFTMWVAMGSIVMMFAGLTSAYIVKRNQPNWKPFNLPPIFWYSTILLLISSFTIYLAVKAFKAHQMARYRMFVIFTSILGTAFLIMQWVGFQTVIQSGVKLIGEKSTSAGSFLAVIAGLHMLHVLGGIIALIVIITQAYFSRKKNYAPITIEVAAIYWHFVDALWLYLFLFLNYID
jgi:cytochrome c oxidase subunit III